MIGLATLKKCRVSKSLKSNVYSSTHFLQHRYVFSEEYRNNKHADRFRPKDSYGSSVPDHRQYKDYQSSDVRERQGSSAARSNAFERSKTYGQSTNSYGAAASPFTGRYGSAPRGNNDFSITLNAIDWDKEQLEPFQKNFYKEKPEVAARTVQEIQEILKENQITINGNPPIPKPIMTFDEVNFPDYIRHEVNKNFPSPTSIQKIGFPIALSGRDFIGVSKTGSGKTLAFTLPAFIHIDAQQPLKRNDGPIALVLAPTRELAAQIHKEAVYYGLNRQIRAALLVGGASKGPQLADLRNGSEMVVGCPGRILDFLKEGCLNLKRVTYLVLDEADRMLDMGFEPQIRKVVSQIRPDRQTLMYSATWPNAVRNLASDFCNEDPVEVKIGSTELHANPDITQHVEVLPHRDKERKCIEFIDAHIKSTQKAKILVFCSTKRFCDQLCEVLRSRQHSAIAIHGDKNQESRNRALYDFRNGQKQILVATDVAARGLDVSDVTVVINFDLPNTIEDYVHRIGRTARGGKTGMSMTFFSADERSSNSTRLAREICHIMNAAGQSPPQALMSASRGGY